MQIDRVHLTKLKLLDALLGADGNTEGLIHMHLTAINKALDIFQRALPEDRKEAFEKLETKRKEAEDFLSDL